MDNLAQTLLCINGLEVDLQRGSVTGHADRSAVLRPTATKVLKLLAAHPGQIVSTEDLIQAMASNTVGSENGLMQCMIEIRQALGDAGHQVVRAGMRRGYVLEAAAIVFDQNTPTRSSARSSASAPMQGHWLAGAIALALAVAAVAFFWPLPQSEAERRQQQLDTLASRLTVAQREVDRFRAERARTREATALRLADTTQVAIRNRQKVELLERELTLARQSIEGLEADATIKATALSASSQDRLRVEEALKNARESQANERRKGESLSLELGKAFQENDALKAELRKMSSVSRDDLTRERARSAGLAQDLAEANARLDTLAATIGKNKSIVTVRTGKSANPQSNIRPVSKSGGREVEGSDSAKQGQPVRLDASSLPSSLLPTKRPVQ